MSFDQGKSTKLSKDGVEDIEPMNSFADRLLAFWDDLFPLPASEQMSPFQQIGQNGSSRAIDRATDDIIKVLLISQ